jgi:peptidyl-prolyl cis-trans isomerase D
MLQSIRDNLKGTLAFIIIGIIIVPLALFGVDSLFSDSGLGQNAAQVNGDDISETDLNRAIYMQKQQMIARFGQNLPADFISDENLREPVLNSLIERELLSQSATDLNMAISSSKLDRMILASSQFQTDGNFDGEKFVAVLRNMGYTPATYKILLERDLINNQLQLGLSASDFTLANELDANAALSLQSRSFSFTTLSKEKVLANTAITSEEVAAYYSDNKSQFVQPEQVAIEYIDLTPDALMAKVDVSEKEIDAQYQEVLADFEASIERRAAHILLELKEDGSEQAKLKELQAELAAGADFAALAKTYSEDVGSSESGGDVGFSSGDTFPEAFEVALAELELDQISAAIETDAGIHIIKLLEIRGADAPSLTEQKPAISSSLKRAKAEAKFTELLESLAEQSYNAESLAEVGADLGLTVAQSELFDRTGGKGITANSKVLEAVFSDDVLNDGNSSDLIELSDQRVVVVKLIQQIESHIKEQSSVTDQIESQLKSVKAEQQLQAQGLEITTALAAGGNLQELAIAADLPAEEVNNIVRSDTSIDIEIVEQAFVLPKPQDGDERSSFSMSNGDVVVLSLTKVDAGLLSSLDDVEQQSLLEKLSSQAAASGYQAFRDELKERAEIDIR